MLVVWLSCVREGSPAAPLPVINPSMSPPPDEVSLAAPGTDTTK